MPRRRPASRDRGNLAVEASLAVALEDPHPRRLVVDHLDASWDAQYGRLAGSLSAGAAGRIEGDGTLSLSGGRDTSLRRAAASGALTAGQAAAALGILGILASGNGSPVSMPIAVRNGIVMAGSFRLAILPPV